MESLSGAPPPTSQAPLQLHQHAPPTTSATADSSRQTMRGGQSAMAHLGLRIEQMGPTLALPTLHSSHRLSAAHLSALHYRNQLMFLSAQQSLARWHSNSWAARPTMLPQRCTWMGRDAGAHPRLLAHSLDILEAVWSLVTVQLSRRSRFGPTRRAVTLLVDLTQ